MIEKFKEHCPYFNYNAKATPTILEENKGFFYLIDRFTGEFICNRWFDIERIRYTDGLEREYIDTPVGIIDAY